MLGAIMRTHRPSLWYLEDVDITSLQSPDWESVHTWLQSFGVVQENSPFNSYWSNAKVA